MTEYILRLFVIVPFVGGLAWCSLWLWKRSQFGGLMRQQAARRVEIVETLTLGTSGKLAVVKFSGRQLLVAASRQGITLISESAADA